MVTTLLDLLTDLRGRLNDPTDTRIDKTTKIRYLNHGIRATWPSLFRTVRDLTTALTDGTYEYALPTVISTMSRVYRVELEESGRFFEWSDYEIIPHLTS